MEIFEFTVIASGKDADENFEGALFEAGCDDATLSFQKGVLIAEFDREAVSFSKAVASACLAVKSAGWKIERIEPDHLVSLSEIADRASLSRQAISLYAKGDRQAGFPPPAAKITSKHPLWDWCEVSEWLHEQHHIPKNIVLQAYVVREANTHIALLDKRQDSFSERLKALEAA